MNIITAANNLFFPQLLNLIGSIHHTNFQQLSYICIFDLGLTKEQKKQLSSIDKILLCNIDLTNPNIIKPYSRIMPKLISKNIAPWFSLQTWKKLLNRKTYIQGAYAWKPVIIKQALDMFETILYVDAGTTILKDLNPLFDHIAENAYFFTDCGHNIHTMTTEFVKNQFQLNNEKNKWILNTNTIGMAGSPIGITRTLYNSYIIPMYTLAMDRSLQYFMDDGTAPGGPGMGRHDQALWSITARLQNYKINTQDNGNGQIIYLYINQQIKPIHITWNPHLVNNKTIIFSSRKYMPDYSFFTQKIKYKTI